jgi:flagellar basal-body rod modification protein FlgD
MTQPTSSSAAGANVAPNTAVTNPASQLGENDFLKLLVAQLKYQDPMSPTDNNQFMQEQASFSTVEGVNNLSATMKAMQASDQQAQSVALIGKQVSYVAADNTLGTGVVSSVTSLNGTLTVHVGNTDIDPSTIVQVADASSGTDTTTSTGGTAGA